MSHWFCSGGGHYLAGGRSRQEMAHGECPGELLRYFMDIYICTYLELLSHYVAGKTLLPRIIRRLGKTSPPQEVAWAQFFPGQLFLGTGALSQRLREACKTTGRVRKWITKRKRPYFPPQARPAAARGKGHASA